MDGITVDVNADDVGTPPEPVSFCNPAVVVTFAVGIIVIVVDGKELATEIRDDPGCCAVAVVIMFVRPVFAADMLVLVAFMVIGLFPGRLIIVVGRAITDVTAFGRVTKTDWLVVVAGVVTPDDVFTVGNCKGTEDDSLVVVVPVPVGLLSLPVMLAVESNVAGAMLVFWNTFIGRWVPLRLVASLLIVGVGDF